MQLALRASLVAREVSATVKLGFDWARARDLQWLFTNARIAPRTREHVLDSFFGFLVALGITDRLLEWNIPLPENALAYADRLIPDARPTLIISPCSSHKARNWRAERYAAVADYAARRHGMRVILCGGPSALETEVGAAVVAAARTEIVNQIGQDTLPQLLALLGRPLLGHVIAERAGHAMHTALVARIMSDPALYEILTFDQLASRVTQALVS